MTTTLGDLHLLVFPFPAQGHLIPLLDLAHYLSLRQPRLSLTVVVTPANVPLLHHFLAATPSASPLVLPISSPSSLAPGVEHVRLLPSPSSFAALIRALSSLRPALLSWARSCPLPPSAIISDFFLGWTHYLAADIGVPRVVFYSSGAFGVSALDFLWHHMPSASTPSSPVPLDSLPSAPVFPYSHLPAIFRRYIAGESDWEFARESFLANSASWGGAINTFDALEGDYLAHLRRSYGHDRIWAVGPIHTTGAPGNRGGRSSIPAEEVLPWLDSCPPRSVVYICFGSQYVPTSAQGATIAAALETSGVRFVWAIGAGVVPEGFVGEKGMVILGWAPQAAILRHDAVASFVTHCGWNSVLEATAAGVVMLAWPMEAEQFVNACLLVEGARVAVRVGYGTAEGMPAAEKLAQALADSVAEGGEWSEVKLRAAELRRRAAEAVAEGGSSYRDFEEFVEQVAELGKKATK
ncbi:UDP-glycosyltransferase 89B1-like [Canna indica]|uniref:UDP-glycosyltransferase 89B1-like n=1 Tax=Canna indica TaxID=4628 RepID=A0AAQ3JST0_9LILI|nr:UDP-glycosyltransferase 89B1-like [Canna indica]